MWASLLLESLRLSSVHGRFLYGATSLCPPIHSTTCSYKNHPLICSFAHSCTVYSAEEIMEHGERYVPLYFKLYPLTSKSCCFVLFLIICIFLLTFPKTLFFFYLNKTGQQAVESSIIYYLFISTVHKQLHQKGESIPRRIHFFHFNVSFFQLYNNIYFEMVVLQK